MKTFKKFINENNFQKGDKVKYTHALDKGDTHKVIEVQGSTVITTGGEFHHTKLKKVNESVIDDSFKKNHRQHWLEGHTAASLGKKINDNPHNRGEAKHAAWNVGFKAFNKVNEDDEASEQAKAERAKEGLDSNGEPIVNQTPKF